jgi:hypothetical protein
MIHPLKEMLGSLIKALDVIYVMEGAKPVSRLIHPEKNTAFLEFLKNNCLHYELSDFKILKHIDSTRGYTDKGIKIPKDDKREGDFFIYISKSSSLAKKAKKLEEENSHVEFGKLLGYPECCCRFFEKNIEEASKATNDLSIHTFKNSKGIVFPWQNNNCLRSFDISLISHFPCSYKCEETKKLAEKNLKVIEKYDKDICNYFRSALKSATIYSEGVGIYSIPRFKAIPLGIEYQPLSVIPSIKNDFFNILKRRNRVIPLSKNNFNIGEIKIEDPQTFFAIFN